MARSKGIGSRISLKQAQDSFNLYAPRDRPLAWTPSFMNEAPRAPRTAPNKHEEHDNQAAIVTYIKTVCPSVILTAGLTGELWGMARHVPKGLFYGWLNKLKSRGLLTGQLDLTLHWEGEKTCFIELKRLKGGKTSDAQETVSLRLKTAGFGVYLCRTIEDIKEVIKKEHIPSIEDTNP